MGVNSQLERPQVVTRDAGELAGRLTIAGEDGLRVDVLEILAFGDPG